jgi:hypothetical protein
MHRIAICLVTNNSYFHYLEKLLPIFQLYNKDVDIVIELYNVPNYKIEWLNANFKNLNLLTYYYKFSTKEVERGYLTNRRVYLIDSLKFSYDYIFYTDVNTIIRFSLFQLIFENGEVDAFIILESSNIWKRALRGVGPLGTKYYGEVLGGFQGFRTGFLMNKFIEHYKGLVSSNYTSWYSDQEALYLSYLIYKNEIIFKLDFDYTFEIERINSCNLFFSKGGADYTSDLSFLSVESGDSFNYESPILMPVHTIRVKLIMRILNVADKIVKGLFK